MAADDVKVLFDESNILDDAYGTEILGVNSENDEYVIVDFVQGNLVGRQLVKKDLLDSLEFGGGPQIPVDMGKGKAMIPVCDLNTVWHSDLETVRELYNRNRLVLFDLKVLPNVNELGPVLSDLYNEALSSTSGMVFLEEDNKDSILKSEMEKSIEEICESIEVDLAKFPALRDVIEIDPDGPENGDPIVTCYMDFSCRVADAYDREKHRSANPFMFNQTSEEVLDYLKEAIGKELDVIEVCKKHGITDRHPRNLEEALYAFGHTSSQKVLRILEKAAHCAGERKGCTVLDGSLKYESQHDRKATLKQVKNWLMKSCDSVAKEIEKLQEKNRVQGR